MNFVNLLLADAPVANWISKSFPIFQTILIILIALLAVAIIVCVLLNPSNSDGGSNAITGANESFYSQNKGSSREGRLKKIIIISSACIFVFTVLYLILTKIYNG
jgi:protein translocase SecG subunit